MGGHFFCTHGCLMCLFLPLHSINIGLHIEFQGESHSHSDFEGMTLQSFSLHLCFEKSNAILCLDSLYMIFFQTESIFLFVPDVIDVGVFHLWYRVLQSSSSLRMYVFQFWEFSCTTPLKKSLSPFFCFCFLNPY